MSEVAVGIHGVTKRFSDVVAVNSLNLDVADGEFFSLLGPSGCGKTTTLRMIAGLEYPTEGSVTIFGEEMGLRPPNKRPVNTVFQSYALFPHMTVAQNVGFGLEMLDVDAGEIATRVDQSIDLVRLSGLGDRRPSSSPVVSNKEWRWPAPWSIDPRCCSSTSHSALSTSSFARQCSSS